MVQHQVPQAPVGGSPAALGTTAAVAAWFGRTVAKDQAVEPLPAAPRHAPLARTIAPLLLAIVFWIQMRSPAGLGVPALYVAPILLFIRAGRCWEPLVVALAATIATTFGFSQPHQAASVHGVYLDRLNLALQLAIIWLSAAPVAYHRVMSDRWGEQVARRQSMLEQIIVRLDELRHALDQAAIVSATDERGIITYVNDKFCEISGYSRDDLLGRDHRILNSGYHPGTFMQTLWRTVAEGHVWRGEIRNKSRDGTLFWVDTTIVPFLDDHGRPRQYLAIRSDITQRKAAEAKLVEQAALTQLGQLAAMVAHEVRNPLAGLRGTLEVLQSPLAALSRERDVIHVMIERIDALNAKVNDILRFARTQPPALQPVDVGPIVNDAVAAASVSVGRERPEVTVTSGPASVRADPEMLRAALLNLLLNACQAGSTRLDIRTFSDAGVCRIEIHDDGCGIPPDSLEHIFEAFYTTKKTGTGLGLPIVKRLLDLQGGTISLKPRPGGGTVATITVQLANQPGDTPASGSAEPVAPTAPGPPNERTLRPNPADHMTSAVTLR